MKRFRELVHEASVEPDTPSRAALTYKEKPNKESMPKLKEDLRKWFDPKHPEGGWKRINSKGEAIGPCAREPGEAKPKCMSNEKRASLSKKERASAVSAKRRHDPNPERKGEPINVSNFGKGKLSEQMDNLEEENKPTNPELWARAKSMAKSKFDVYPSAYANGWAAKWYKSKGGGWRSVNEETDTTEKEEMVQSQLHFIKYACEEILDYIEQGGEVEEWYQVKVAKSFSEFESLHAYMEGESRRTGMKEEVEMKESVFDFKRFDKMTKGEYPKHDKIARSLTKTAMDTNKISDHKAAIKAHKNAITKLPHDSVTYKGAHNSFIDDHEQAINKKRNVAEEVEQIDEIMAEPDYNQSIKARQEKADKDLPFTPDPPKKKSVVAGKHGEAYSRVRHLARQALKKQSDKLRPVKESLEESRKTEIVKEIMKKKKNDKDNTDTFQKEPVLSSEIVKA
jgi:hypothetical protein